MFKYFLITLSLLLTFSACSDEKEVKKGSVGMSKCGAGKCGANMFDGNSALAKKKKNILRQMREDDPRKDCVIKAKSTKEAYTCVRHPQTKKLSLKCGVEDMKQMKKEPAMKCGASKCGNRSK